LGVPADGEMLASGIWHWPLRCWPCWPLSAA